MGGHGRVVRATRGWVMAPPPRPGSLAPTYTQPFCPRPDARRINPPPWNAAFCEHADVCFMSPVAALVYGRRGSGARLDSQTPSSGTPTCREMGVWAAVRLTRRRIWRLGQSGGEGRGSLWRHLIPVCYVFPHVNSTH